VLQKLNDPSMAEFGFSMTELGGFLRTVGQIGVGEGHGIALIPLERLSKVIALRLKWLEEKVAVEIGLNEYQSCSGERLRVGTHADVEEKRPRRGR